MGYGMGVKIAFLCREYYFVQFIRWRWIVCHLLSKWGCWFNREVKGGTYGFCPWNPPSTDGVMGSIFCLRTSYYLLPPCTFTSWIFYLQAASMAQTHKFISMGTLDKNALSSILQVIFWLLASNRGASTNKIEQNI